MIQQSDAKQIRRFSHPLGKHAVGPTGRRIAARMAVDQDYSDSHGGSIVGDGWPEHITRVDQCFGQRAYGNDVPVDDRVPLVEGEDSEDLLAQVAHVCALLGYVGGSEHARPGRFAGYRHGEGYGGSVGHGLSLPSVKYEGFLLHEISFQQ
jgi:hypothetical protein